MKNRSIRFKITFWYSAALIILIGIVMLIVYIAGSMVLRSTIRDYLVSVVEVNADEIVFVPEKETTDLDSDIYIIYEDGYLKVDDDFMDAVHDVKSAVYTDDGTLLYGEDSLAKVTEFVPFTETHLWNTNYNGVDYNIYDRKLNLNTSDEGSVWLRGIVSEEDNVKKLSDIMGLSFLIMPFLIIIAILLGYIIAGGTLKPIRKLEQTAGKISRGSDLKQRIETGGGKDEITDLANVFNDMISRLDNAFETERRFTSDASHELRTPMAVILAQSEYILEKERSNEDYKNALQVVKRQGDRMNLLINDMLDYTRMDQSPDRYPMEQLDLSAVIKESAGSLDKLKEKNIVLETEIEPDIGIIGNELLLTRMTDNLISNAYRYGRENGKIRVSLKMEDRFGDGQMIPVLSVEDDGIGIKKEEQDKIFERFYRGDVSRSVKGTGLGLSMVKKVAELHHASVELESELGKGSKFSIVFGKPI